MVSPYINEKSISFIVFTAKSGAPTFLSKV